MRLLSIVSLVALAATAVSADLTASQVQTSLDKLSSLSEKATSKLGRVSITSVTGRCST